MLCKSKIIEKKKSYIKHPWETTIKDEYSPNIKYAHNSVNNHPHYTLKKKRRADNAHIKFTVIGNRVTKEFIYCVSLVNGLWKYRKNEFDAPVIRAVNGVEWPGVLHDIKLKYSGLAYCLPGQVAVLMNDQFLGGENELKELIEAKYTYHICPDYYNEAIAEFSKYIDSSARPCVYMHFSINGCDDGTMIFMLYSDMVPRTCDNFMRLCKAKRGGYSGTPVHRIVKDGWIQCGGFGLKATQLDCENFIVPPDRRGVLCMANDGRHIDCSTQFFVLLQAAPWMEKKYVAFGQLIDGEETLKKIENIPTWYEAPTCEITIYESGILNLECQDLIINKGINEYIQGHIENLAELSKVCKNWILDTIFTEVEARELAKHEQEEEPEEIDEDRTNIRATERFLRKKEEIEKQLETNESDDFNEDFDVEYYESEIEFESEEATSLKLPSLESNEKADVPYYIPLTDVPYPGEIESSHDLKKFLKGHYCLETDLIKEVPKKVVKRKTISYTSEIFNLNEVNDIGELSLTSLDSDDEREIRRYIKFNVDRVSFAGGIVRGIARGVGKYNIFEGARKKGLLWYCDYCGRQRSSLLHEYGQIRPRKNHDLAEDHVKFCVSPGSISELITDEESRKFRLTSIDTRSKEQEKKVSIAVPETQKTPEKIKRRATGFPMPAAVDKVIRKTGNSTIEDEESLETGDAAQTVDLRKVRIAPALPSKASERRPTSEQRDGSDTEVHRRSVLSRLMDDVAHVDEPGPILKDYKPMSESKQRNILLTRNLLLYSNYFDEKSEDNTRNKYIRPTLKMETPSIDRVMNIQHSKKLVRKISSDYVKTLGQIEQPFENSIRSIEFAKKRPSMSVAQYQRMNQLLRESFKEPQNQS